MMVLRFLLIVFNVAVVTFLVYRLLLIGDQPMEKSKKILIVIGGILLLLAPLGMFMGIFMPTFQYFLIYPIAISLFLYLTKQL
jgi:amino acid transporter